MSKPKLTYLTLGTVEDEPNKIGNGACLMHAPNLRPKWTHGLREPGSRWTLVKCKIWHTSWLNKLYDYHKSYFETLSGQSPYKYIIITPY